MKYKFVVNIYFFSLLFTPPENFFSFKTNILSSK